MLQAGQDRFEVDARPASRWVVLEPRSRVSQQPGQASVRERPEGRQPPRDQTVSLQEREILVRGIQRRQRHRFLGGRPGREEEEEEEKKKKEEEEEEEKEEKNRDPMRLHGSKYPGIGFGGVGVASLKMRFP